MKIIAISGSLRKASTNTGLCRALQRFAPAHVAIEIVTLNGIPVYNGDDEAASGKPQLVKDIDQKIRAADAVIIATPEYNFSIPGGLKNASDWLSRGGSPFKWKTVGLIGSADGPLGTGRSQYHLRQNLQALEAITMPKPEFFAGNASQKFNASGDLTEEDSLKRLSTWLLAFVEFASRKA